MADNSGRKAVRLPDEGYQRVDEAGPIIHVDEKLATEWHCTVPRLHNVKMTMASIRFSLARYRNITKPFRRANCMKLCRTNIFRV